MLHIGCHLSSSKGYMAMAKDAEYLGADTFAFFTRNPRGGKAKELDATDVREFKDFFVKRSFAPLVAHSPYTLNPCAANVSLRGYAYQTMLDDMLRLSYTPNNYYNFHPGCHVQQGSDVGIKLTADLLAHVVIAEQGFVEDSPFKEASPVSTVILVETMAGKGSEIGRTFEEVHDILLFAQEKYGELTKNIRAAALFENAVGVCVDTCHIWDGGYDIVSDIDSVIQKFDKTIGLERLHAVHLNDSMNPCGSHKDRHQKIGKGYIGFEALARLTRHPALKELPFILETPNELDGYKAEIEMLRNAAVMP